MRHVRVAIIGGGIAGLAAARWLEADAGIADVVVLEAAPRAGGKVRTATEAGHILEWGPQGFLDNAPDTLELARSVGLDDALVRADEAAAARFIVRDGRPREVPLKPPAFLLSDVLPPTGRLRVLGEPFARRRPAGDESVFDFARRRIGRQAAEILVDAMVTGVFAGDPRRLSLAATFPKMAAMEAEHGSLVRAMIAKRKAARREGVAAGGPAGPGGTLTTFVRGMEQLPAALADGLGERLRTGAAVRTLARHQDRWVLSGDGVDLTADAIVLALPARAAAPLVAEHAPAAVTPLQAITTAPIAVVMTSYRDRTGFAGRTDGFGVLVPGRERLPILGTLFCHDIFPVQAPPGRLFLRTMLGGARDPEAIELDDAALITRVRTTLDGLLGGDPEPEHTWVVRWPEGIAQYTLGHLDRVSAVEDACRAAGLEVTGSSYRGVSVNDCIRNARAAAARVAASF